VEDVTEKKREEARLRRAESLASLTTLAAGVAHEIKNPLGAVGIHLQLARKALAAEAASHGCEVDGKVTRHLGVVEEELDRLNRIVLDFLFAVRPMDVAPEEDDLDKVVREAAELVRPEAEGAGVRLELSLSLSLPRVRIDRRYVRQAILNLAKNALAAMPGGGVLRFATARSDEAVALEVSDTGSGIAEEKLGKIFEPYYTTKSDGTGLGLTITYKIMKEHGGDIQVRSKPGQGTVFTLAFPLPRTERRLLEYDAELRAEAEGRE
ncbi:MAG TPA: ATP-binding protein, partial [Spirochaetales bacterium]|nr:ATP-binding protein [Spirochaetales bacterium]